jgi:ankyrin repeat protein
MASSVILALSVVLGINFASLEVNRFRTEAAKRAQREALTEINTVFQIRDDPATVVGLLKRLPTEEARKRPLLERATYNGRIETVRALLELGFDPDGRNGNGNPLRTAAAFGNTPLVSLLLKHGAQPELLSQDGRNALHWAAAAGKNETVRVLLDAGLSVDARTGPPPSLGEDNQPLISSVSGFGPPPLPGDQTQGGALVDTEFRERDVTPLMFAAGNGHAETVALLLSRGANSGLRTARGKTAQYFATRFGHTETMHLLQRASLAAAHPGGR